MVRPVCVPCQRLFRPSKTGRPFIEQMPVVNRPTPGASNPEQWRPYKLWWGDEYTCPGCNAIVIVNMTYPMAEHFQPDFDVTIERCGGDDILRVNDC